MTQRLCLIPLDARPVCYDFPRQLAAVIGLDLCMPDKNLLGQLKRPADEAALIRWLQNYLAQNDPAAQSMIIALDTPAYGGLISSRVGDETEAEIQARLTRFFSDLKPASLYGFSSILRIPAYDNDEEEPTYWLQYGRRLYEYSAACHRQAVQASRAFSGQADQALSSKTPPDTPPEAEPMAAGVPAPGIPEEVLADFMARRRRNFNVNLGYLGRLKCGELDYLAFCQDDTGPYGLNVQEAEALRQEIQGEGLDARAHVQTGADELAVALMARWLSENRLSEAGGRPLQIYPVYTHVDGGKAMARFDGLPIETVVHRQIQTCGAEVAASARTADLWLLVHTPAGKDARQGDHCENLIAQVEPAQLNGAVDFLEQAVLEKKPIVLADVAYANGGDPALIDRLLESFEDLSFLFGYAAWNTPGNTLGSALAMGIVRLLAESQNRFDADAFARLMLVRLADDGYYQTIVRRQIRGESLVGTPTDDRDMLGGVRPDSGPPPGRDPLDENRLNEKMAAGLALLQQRLGLSVPVSCRFPCGRTFEVEIQISTIR